MNWKRATSLGGRMNGSTVIDLPTRTSILQKEALRYGAAVLLAALSVVVRSALTPLFGPQYPFITAFFAVALSARFLGTGPALLTTVLSLSAALYFFAPQEREGFNLDFGLSAWVGLLLNLTFNALIAWFVGSLKTEKENVEIARRRLEDADRELRDRATKLQKANEAQSALLAAVAHEMRNPLQPVLAAASLIKARPGDTHSAAKAAEMIERQALHARRITDDLVDLSRVGLPKLELRRKRIELRVAIQSAIEQVQGQMRTKDQRLHLTGLDGNVDPR